MHWSELGVGQKTYIMATTWCLLSGMQLGLLLSDVALGAYHLFQVGAFLATLAGAIWYWRNGWKSQMNKRMFQHMLILCGEGAESRARRLGPEARLD